MKQFFLLLLFSFSIITQAQTPCVGNTADGFPCDGYQLQSNLPLTTFSASSGNDSWGWTDPSDGKEYVLMGLNNGTAFIDISDPVNPVYLGKLPTHSFDSQWRDVKVYNNHAFIVSEADNHGMQVFDLTRLRTVVNPPVVFTEDGHYDGFLRAHNVVINEAEAYAYGVGTQTFSGGPHFVDISDPTNPVAAGGFSGYGYSHDAQVVTYNGPDTDYAGREIYVGSNEDEVAIVDVTDKNNPVAIASIGYSNIGYTHQGWFTEDQRYFIVGDELDELFFGFMTRIIIMDFTDLDNPQLHFEYTGTTQASDHNLYVLGDTMYLANYRGGMRVYDISDIENQNIIETGYFDTYPPNDNAGASVGDPGAWNVYPYFQSSNLIVTNYSDNGGMFVVRDESILSVNESAALSATIFPNPTTDAFSIRLDAMPITKVVVYDLFGKVLYENDQINAASYTVDIASFASGIYMVRINDTISAKISKQ